MLCYAMLSHFSHVGLCATPQTAAHQAPPSLGFSRQEHWSGLPFPSPMHESEKWKWKWSRVRLLATLWIAAYQAPPSMGFSKQEYWSGVPLPSPYLVIIFSSIYHHLICILIYLFVYLLFIPLLYKCHSHRIFVLFSTLSLEKEMATHSSVLAWRISGTGEPGGCRLWGHTESDTTEVT